ncbi:dihydrofolate reductase family protein [Imtechella halotolerans]|uniref:Deaminase-reductase domain-containing protein n=1 Tax=Imtechella halotolerans K1 TaxID=946077 RepID=I0WDQ3_9FLAO|nr:dihydrofolate reductase family protein [Imtechella halotolerans]EID74519.1 deaminase-reductase domain-containing protein [Imtechella halotolerans K1]WMQ62369.1 dihydrofolate reductase family protein [Imtechella halotolerans]
MGKIIVLSMISLDGVIQAPGGDKEDSSGGFNYGGWTAPYGDKIFSKSLQEELRPAVYLLGRKTFEIWESYWPYNTKFWPGINSGKKYVFSKSRSSSTWNNSIFINTISAIENIKRSEESDIQVWGSSELVHLLFSHGLVDELRLKIYPIVLGKGKRLFDGNSLPISFTLMESNITTTGVLLMNYQRLGEVKSGIISG